MDKVADNNQQPHAAAQNQGAPLVLIVEDDISLSKMYSMKFQSSGFRVLVANDGAQGLAMAAQEKPDIILLDMMLPKYSGIEFLEQLQQHSKSFINTPVLALTNLAEKQDANRALALGVKEYLTKAMHSPEEVVEKVRKYVTKSGEPQPSPNNTSTTQS